MSEKTTVRRKWRVIDEKGKECGVWIERFNRNSAYDEAWALDCAARYYPDYEVQVQTTTTTVSAWAPVATEDGQR